MQMHDEATQPSFHRDEHLPSPGEGWILVFGASEGGRHGTGIAKLAKTMFGARFGVGRGPTGQAYAIAVRTNEGRPLALPEVERGVEDFLLYARLHPEQRFFVTRVGCEFLEQGDDRIGPLFTAAGANVSLPQSWRIYFASRASRPLSPE